MTKSCRIVRSSLTLALLAIAGPALADSEAEIERPAGSSHEEENELHGRLYLSHSMAYDADTEGGSRICRSASTSTAAPGAAGTSRPTTA